MQCFILGRPRSDLQTVSAGKPFKIGGLLPLLPRLRSCFCVDAGTIWSVLIFRKMLLLGRNKQNGQMDSGPSHSSAFNAPALSSTGWSKSCSLLCNLDDLCPQSTVFCCKLNSTISLSLPGPNFFVLWDFLELSSLVSSDSHFGAQTCKMSFTWSALRTELLCKMEPHTFYMSSGSRYKGDKKIWDHINKPNTSNCTCSICS